MKENKERTSPWAPLIIIAIGIVFILNNFGVLPWGIWGVLWKFWPIVLVLWGFEMIIGKDRAGNLMTLVLFLIFVIWIVLSIRDTRILEKWDSQNRDDYSEFLSPFSLVPRSIRFSSIV